MAVPLVVSEYTYIPGPDIYRSPPIQLKSGLSLHVRDLDPSFVGSSSDPIDRAGQEMPEVHASRILAEWDHGTEANEASFTSSIVKADLTSGRGVQVLVEAMLAVLLLPAGQAAPGGQGVFFTATLEVTH